MPNFTLLLLTFAHWHRLEMCPSGTEGIEGGGRYGFSLQILSTHTFCPVPRWVLHGLQFFNEIPSCSTMRSSTGPPAALGLLALPLASSHRGHHSCSPSAANTHLKPIQRQSTLIRISALCQVDIFLKAAGLTSGWTHFLAKAEVFNFKYL